MNQGQSSVTSQPNFTDTNGQSPAPPQNGPAALPGDPNTSKAAADNSWTSESLWKDAYEILKKEESGLTQAFEQVLSSGAGEFTSEEEITSALEAKLKQRDERQFAVHLAGKSVNIRKCGKKLIKFALWSKDIVSDSLSNQPHLALAWSGVTILLPVCILEWSQWWQRSWLPMF